MLDDSFMALFGFAFIFLFGFLLLKGLEKFVNGIEFVAGKEKNSDFGFKIFVGVLLAIVLLAAVFGG